MVLHVGQVPMLVYDKSRNITTNIASIYKEKLVILKSIEIIFISREVTNTGRYSIGCLISNSS